jgi:hypothetical protein
MCGQDLAVVRLVCASSLATIGRTEEREGNKKRPARMALPSRLETVVILGAWVSPCGSPLEAS